jgi:hypothetical protein
VEKLWTVQRRPYIQDCTLIYTNHLSDKQGVVICLNIISAIMCRTSGIDSKNPSPCLYSQQATSFELEEVKSFAQGDTSDSWSGHFCHVKPMHGTYSHDIIPWGCTLDSYLISGCSWGTFAGGGATWGETPSAVGRGETPLFGVNFWMFFFYHIFIIFAPLTP